jgi:hypothetical protein
MRMWMIDTKLLCDKHLIGEHGELHKHIHNFVKKHNMATRIEKGQIEVESMGTRHDELAQEMLDRGFRHQSSFQMPDISYIPESLRIRKVDINANLAELRSKCTKCRSTQDTKNLTGGTQ